MEPLWPQSPTVDAVFSTPAYPNNLSIRDGYVEGAPIGAEHTARLHPALRYAGDALVAAFRPIALSEIRSARAHISAILSRL